MALSLAVLMVACSAAPRDRHPIVRDIYRTAARREARNPVIVIHGILGARLEERATKRTLWGAFTEDYADPETADGAALIALPLKAPGSALAYEPTSTPTGASGPLGALRLSFLFQIINVSVYADILRVLGIGGFRDPVAVDPGTPDYAEGHFTCFTFFYDWRRDNVENAIQLGRFIRERRQEIGRRAPARVAILRQKGDPESLREADEIEAWLQSGYRFDLVAHSMGGLIAHYYLRYGESDLPADGSAPEVTWAGAAEVDRLIQVGTPNFGAVDALRQLHGGFQPAFFLPKFSPALLGTMPSIYQLLPRTRHKVLLDEKGEVADADLLSPKLWQDNGWGLADPGQDRMLRWLLPDVKEADQRRNIAVAYQAWCLQRAAAFHAALDQPATKVPVTKIYMFAADAEPTVSRAVLARRAGKLVPTFDRPECLLPGDITVPRYSTVADERTGSASQPWLVSPIPWTSVTFLADDHVGLTRNPQFVDNTLFILLDTPPPVR
jgi:pimeloyl-ACP methyl ester carboxylesterase